MESIPLGIKIEAEILLVLIATWIARIRKDLKNMIDFIISNDSTKVSDSFDNEDKFQMKISNGS